MTEALACPVRDQFADPETLESPFGYYRQLQVEAPVFYSKTLASYVVSRFKDVQSVAQNPALFSSSPPRNQTTTMASFSDVYHAMYEEAGLPPRIPTLVTTDGDTHRRYRQIADPFFSPRAVKGMESQLQEIIDRLIEGFIDRYEVDIYREFALLVPLYVICDILGLPRENARLMQEAGDASTDLAGAGVLDEEGRRAAHRTLIKLGHFLKGYIEKYRNNPADNLLSHLIHGTTRDGDHLTEQEILGMCMTLNVGGNETTTNGIGNMLWLVLQDSKLEAHLREARDDIPRFAEEALRLESPVCSLMRWANEDVVVGGVEIPKGACLHLRIPAANRDEEQFKCPAEVDLRRPSIRNHLAFGNGVHYCLGVHLSRAEMRLALNRIFDRMDSLKIDESKGPIRHNFKTQVRSLTSLPITFEAR